MGSLERERGLPLGGIDISPIILLLVLQGTRIYLLPIIFAPLQRILG